MTKETYERIKELDSGEVLTNLEDWQELPPVIPDFDFELNHQELFVWFILKKI